MGSEGVPGVFRAKEGPGQISEDAVPRGVQEARTGRSWPGKSVINRPDAEWCRNK